MNDNQSSKSTEKSDSPVCSPKVTKVFRSMKETKKIAEEMKKKKSDSLKYTQVCLYWLKNLWIKGNEWEYLHYYDKEKMPICKRFLLGDCPNGREWLFNHRQNPSTRRIWKYYEKGFWFHGGIWPGFHKRVTLCPNYIEGFWAKGPKWEYIHLKCLVSPEDDRLEVLIKQYKLCNSKSNVMSICHKWGTRGHTSDTWKNPKISQNELFEILKSDPEYMEKLKTVICHKCCEVGHYPIMWKKSAEKYEKKLPERNIDSKVKETSQKKGTKFTGDPSLNESAMETIYNWNQLFSAIKNFYDDNTKLFDWVDKLNTRFL